MEVRLEQEPDAFQSIHESKAQNSLCKSLITDAAEQNGLFVQQNHIPNPVSRTVAEFNLREGIRQMEEKMREMKIFTHSS